MALLKLKLLKIIWTLSKKKMQLKSSPGMKRNLKLLIIWQRSILGRNLENSSSLVQQGPSGTLTQPDRFHSSVPGTMAQSQQPQLPGPAKVSGELKTMASSIAQFDTLERTDTPDLTNPQALPTTGVPQDSYAQGLAARTTTPSIPTETGAHEPKRIKLSIVEKKMSISSMLNDEPTTPNISDLIPINSTSANTFSLANNVSTLSNELGQDASRDVPISTIATIDTTAEHTISGPNVDDESKTH